MQLVDAYSILCRSLESVQYQDDLEPRRILNGDYTAYLPIFRFMMISFSPNLYRKLADTEYLNFGKDDITLLRNVYQLITNIFRYVPCLDISSFLSESGKAYEKILFTHDFIRNCKRLHNQEVKNNSSDEEASNKVKLSSSLNTGDSAHETEQIPLTRTA